MPHVKDFALWETRLTMVRELLEANPTGLTTSELRKVIGVKNVTRVIDSERKAGNIACWPIKGTGSKWYLVKHESLVMDEWMRHRQRQEDARHAYDVARRARRRAGFCNHGLPDVDYSAPRYSSVWHFADVHAARSRA